jgi:exopolysaccharide production protein ExoQ
MPPSDALILCTLFVLIIFRLSGDKIPGASPAVWIPTIWILYCASRPIAAWFGEGDQQVQEGSAVDRDLLCILIFIGWWILKRRNLNWGKVMRDNRWLVLLCGYMAISIAWSDYSFVSFKRWCRFCATPMMGLIVITEASPLAAVEQIFRRTAYLLLPISVLLVKYYPDLGVQYNIWTGERMWVGVTTQKNSLGRLCLISAFFLARELIRAWPQRRQAEVKWRMRTDMVVILIAAYLLSNRHGAYSATSIAALFAGLAMYLGLLWTGKRQWKIGVRALKIIVGLAICFGIIIPVAGGSEAFSLVAVLGRDATFTGRTEIWQAVLPAALRNPVLGCGYGSFWINPPISYNLSLMVNEAHNGYLDVFTELGIVGLVLFLGFLISSFRTAWRALDIDFEWAAFALCFLLVIVIHNITESSFLRPTNHMGATLFFLVLVIYRVRMPGLVVETNGHSVERMEAIPVRQKDY